MRRLSLASALVISLGLGSIQVTPTTASLSTDNAAGSWTATASMAPRAPA